MKRLPVLLAFALALPGCELILNPDRDIVLGGDDGGWQKFDGGGEVPDGGGCPSLTCTIGGRVYCDSEVNPASPCQACVPQSNDDAWSTLNDGAWCTDGGDGICYEGTCRGDLCFVEGGVKSAGDDNMANPCEECVPDANRTGWTKVADETSCGGGSKCFNGVCTECGCSGRQCGNDPCDATNDCGSCTMPLVCNSAGQCACELPCGMECCDAATQVCGPSSVCIAKPTESGDWDCSDGADNDSDGPIDCGDEDCCKNGSPVGGVTVCGGACTLIKCPNGVPLCGGVCCSPTEACNANFCMPKTGSEDTDPACSDGTDNDDNGLFDCDDPACCNGGLTVCTSGCGMSSCGAAERRCGKVCCQKGAPCNAGSCGGVPVETGDADCGDGKDNDLDLMPDCEDSDCCSAPLCAGNCPAMKCKMGQSRCGATCCVSGQACVAGVCSATTCDLFAQDCVNPLDACYPDVSPFCAPAGASPEGDTCTEQHDCEKRLACMADVTAMPKCTRLCQSGVECSSDQDCTMQPAGYGLCTCVAGFLTTSGCGCTSSSDCNAHPGLECGTSMRCVPVNDRCATATSFAFSSTEWGDTTLAADDASGCSGVGSGAPEVVYSFNVDQLKTYRFTVTADGAGSPDYQPAVYLHTEGSCPSTFAAGPCDEGVDGVAVVEFRPKKTTAAWVFVDGLSGTKGKFMLVGEELASMSMPPNDSCATRAPFVASPTSGSTTTAFNDHLSPGSCGWGSQAGADVVYVYTATAMATGAHTIKVTPKTSWDLSVWVTKDLCGDTGSCVAFANAEGELGTETVVIDHPGGQVDYYIVVDSALKSSRGDFDMSISPP